MFGEIWTCKGLSLDLPPSLNSYVDSVLIQSGGDKSSTLHLSDAFRSGVITLKVIEDAFDSVRLAIRRRINTFAPINRLPNEILSSIFRMDAAPSIPSKGGSQMVALSVCSHWRLVVLSDPVLFKAISIEGATDRTDKVLSSIFPLTKHALIDVNVDFNRPPSIHFMSVSEERAMLVAKTLNNHLHHMQSLKMAFRTEHASVILDQLTSPAPSLEVLDVTQGSDVYMRSIAPFPAETFAGCTPNLRNLTLAYVMPTCWTFPSLRSLSLTTFPSFPISTFGKIFSACPFLEKVRLDTSYSPPPRVGQTPSELSEWHPDPSSSLWITTHLKEIDFVSVTEAACSHFLSCVDADAVQTITYTAGSIECCPSIFVTDIAKCSTLETTLKCRSSDSMIQVLQSEARSTQGGDEVDEVVQSASHFKRMATFHSMNEDNVFRSILAYSGPLHSRLITKLVVGARCWPELVEALLSPIPQVSRVRHLCIDVDSVDSDSWMDFVRTPVRLPFLSLEELHFRRLRTRGIFGPTPSHLAGSGPRVLPDGFVSTFITTSLRYSAAKLPVLALAGFVCSEVELERLKDVVSEVICQATGVAGAFN